MAIKNPKKRHHYIPVFYLKGFVNSKGCLWVYDKDDAGMFESSPEGIAYENHYFSFITPLGDKDSETVENMMMEIETNSAKVTKKIIANQPLNEEERIAFAIFVASMMVRTPNFRNNIQKSTGEMIKHLSVFMASNKNGFESMLGKFEKNTGEKIGMSVEEFRQWMLNPDNYSVSVDSQYAVGMALSQLESLAGTFFHMKWAFIKATEDYKYLTGDNPLSYVDPTHDRHSFFGVGLASKNIEVTLPLSKDVCALGSWKHGEGYCQGSSQHVKYVNRMTVVSSLRFVFAHNCSEDLNRFVKKYKGSHPVIRVN